MNKKSRVNKQGKLVNKVDRLVAETKPIIKALETNNQIGLQRAAWIAVADNLIRIQRAEPSWGTAGIGMLFDKSGSWVDRIVRWRTTSSSSTSPFSRAAREERGEPSPDDSSARKVLRERPEKIVPEIAKAMEDPEIAAAVTRTSKKAAHNVALASMEEQIKKNPSKSGKRTSADIDAASASRLPTPPQPDPWQKWYPAVRAADECIEGFEAVFDRMHPDAWNQPPSIVEGIERDALRLAEKLREQAEFLEGLAEAAGQTINR